VMDDDCDGLTSLLQELTGNANWPIGRMRLANLAGIDHGLVARLSGTTVQLMPHGGLRVVQRLISWLVERGAEVADSQNSRVIREVFPEAADVSEAALLQRLSHAASPLAIDLLLDQPRRWREFMSAGKQFGPDDRERSKRLNRLIDPPIVVLAGRPNVGKSTLSNALFGRAMSIAMDQPGTTRDYTVGLIDLAGLTVQWHDTPGLRVTDDPIETQAIDVARRLIERADVLIAIRDPATDWPVLPRNADLWVLSKADSQPIQPNSADVCTDADHPVLISALTGFGLAELVIAVRDRLVPPDDLSHPNPWLHHAIEVV